jgi:hypothetical protein
VVGAEHQNCVKLAFDALGLLVKISDVITGIGKLFDGFGLGHA